MKGERKICSNLLWKYEKLFQNDRCVTVKACDDHVGERVSDSLEHAAQQVPFQKKPFQIHTRLFSAREEPLEIRTRVHYVSYRMGISNSHASLFTAV